MLLVRHLLALLAAGLFLAHAPLAAQSQPEPRESSITRARVAVALRDSLLRLNTNMREGLVGVELSASDADRMAKFLRNPFDPAVVPAPSLHELEVALARVNTELKNNPGDEEEEEDGQGAPEGAKNGAGVGNVGQGLLGTLGMPSEAQLLIGLTDFMVERARDDVAFGFVLTLRNNVRDDRWIRLGLPRSYELMQRMDDGTYSTFMPVLRAAFVEDLNQLPGRAYELAEALDSDGGKANYLRGLAIAYQRGLEIRQGSPPAAALANLAGVTSVQMPDDVSRRALRMVGLVAREYAAGGGEQLVQELAREDRGWLRRYLVGFLARDLVATEGLEDQGRTDLLEFMSARDADVVVLLNQLDATRAVLQDVERTAQQAVADLREAEDEAREAGEQAQNALDRALASAAAVLQVMSAGQRFLYWGVGSEPAAVREFREFVSDANTLHQAFMKRDYASLVTWAVQRPELRLCVAEVRAVPAVRAEVEAEVTREILQARNAPAGATLNRRERASVEPEVRRRLAARAGRCGVRTQYLSFAATLASARSAQEVTVALRQVSAPVGSYRAKRNQYVRVGGGDRHPRTGPLSVTLGGYLGVAGGGEQGAYHFGAALPVGAELSYGVPLGAVSLFVPLIDVGTLASTRFGEDNDQEGEDELDETGPTFRQVLAPGAFLVWNISRSVPFSVGAGWQAVPDLRERDGDRVSVGRWSIFVGADVTMLNFRF